ncbi:MAG TPA: dTMP kinase [Dehalococcoidales bacterium]|nr:dTMP kinase [Dehalococcoidales bacterium]
MSLFITFEGGEGSGKSTQARLLYRKLNQMSVPAILIHEPGSTPVGEKLARILKHGKDTGISALTELFLFNAARAQLVNEIIRPALKKGKVVICDRYTDSTIAYQGYGRGVDSQIIRQTNEQATEGLKPDLTIFVDVPVKTGLARKTQEADRFERESITFHNKVRNGYLALIEQEPKRFLVVDGNKTKKQIAAEILGIVSSKIGKNSLRW